MPRVMMCGFVQLELQQPPVPDQIPRRVRAIGQHPLQRRQRQELRLARIPQPRTPPPLVQRRAPHRRHASTPTRPIEPGLAAILTRDRLRAVMAGKPTRAPQRGLVTLTWASWTGIGKDPVFRRLIVLASTALITGALAGCGNTDSWVEAHAASGWPAQYGDASNSSYEPTAGADTLRLEWTRSVKGDLAAAVALGSGSYLAVNAQTRGGCSLMVWEADNNARQRWCTRLVQGGGPVQSVVRRVRQPLHRPARRDAVVPADAMDPVAQAGHRNAHHTKDSRPRAAAGGHASRPGPRVRRTQRHALSARRWTWSPASIRPTPNAD